MFDKLHVLRSEIARAAGRVITLTHTERDVLQAIAKRAPLTATPWEIAEDIWGNENRWPHGWESNIRVHVWNIRHKSQRGTFSIMTHHGTGYRLDGVLDIVEQ